ncbi:acyl-CoA dehydrogenase family protein [Aquimarina macrocephali]|uniref:acyl-CoA dehydrogenase family protein n=1 Tax=Aquimarina macrocephali TaxID=666563 RepID=UPI0005533F56|nr:acyl-CoA dehydrogenase family protein [Aquimarina macrocephali]
MKNMIIDNQKINRKTELEKVCDKLYKVEKTKNYKEFYAFIKTTRLPFIPCHEKNTETVYQECFRILHRIGEISIPVSVALSMHYYILASLSSFPFPKKSIQYWKREVLLKKIEKEQILIANTGSVRTFKEVSGNKDIVAQKERNFYIINGRAPYMSLSGVADYLVFTATLTNETKAVFFLPANDDKIEFEDAVFGDTMKGSFTKSVTFKNLVVSSTNVIKLDTTNEDGCELLIYQRSWFQALVPGSYLGAAFCVILHLKAFSQKKIKNDKKLSESENFLDSLGELMIKYKTGYMLCENAGTIIANFEKGNKTSLEKIFEASVVAKYFSTHFSEEIINKTRYVMGSKFLSPNSLTNKIYKEIVYGVLQPMTDIDIKEHFSKSVMKNKSYDFL